MQMRLALWITLVVVTLYMINCSEAIRKPGNKQVKKVDMAIEKKEMKDKLLQLEDKKKPNIVCDTDEWGNLIPSPTCPVK